MAETPASTFIMGNLHVPMSPERIWRFASAKLTIKAARSGSPGANSVRRTRPARIRLRFVLKINNFGARSAVDEPRFGCGRTPGAVAPIPQITSLDPGKPRGAIRGLQSAATHHANL